MRYSKKRKEAVLKKMMAPHNRTIKELAIEEGICEATLYNWRNKTRQQGLLLPGSGIKQPRKTVSSIGVNNFSY